MLRIHYPELHSQTETWMLKPTAISGGLHWSIHCAAIPASEQWLEEHRKADILNMSE